ncbi:MAG TPA: hypothetical protein VNA15_05210 [Candidatus Angelobacter sp.]|nr:hypothetical protein [Candidatus Angelobacter sp.]
MKTIDGHKPNSAQSDSNAFLSLASERGPSTVVGFKADPSLTPWSRWANRFIVAAIVQGALAVGVSAYLLYDATYDTPGAARIVASGGPGTWLTAGYLGFIMLGPLAAAVTSLFYQHLEAHLRAPYSGFSNVLAWLHIILLNVGVVGATFIMMNGGWRGGALALTLSPNNPSAAYGQVHEQVLGGLPSYIAWFSAIAILGAVAGGLGYVVAWKRSRKQSVP